MSTLRTRARPSTDRRDPRPAKGHACHAADPIASIGAEPIGRCRTKSAVGPDRISAGAGACAVDFRGTAALCRTVAFHDAVVFDSAVDSRRAIAFPRPAEFSRASAIAITIGPRAGDRRRRFRIAAHPADPPMALWADQRLRRCSMAEAPNALPPRDKVRAAVAAARLAPGRPSLAFPANAQEARRLNDAARAAFYNRDNPQEALRLEVAAFAANPLDAEVAGNLAFYRMRQSPPQVEAARQLSLHSLALPDPRYPAGRIEDWINLAITSALLGREADARRAWTIALALTDDVERVRTAGIKARRLYGDRLRPSVEAMLWRSRLA